MNSTGVKVDAASEINGIIPFHLAAQGGHEIVANLLISRSAESLFTTDKFQKTCLHFAASRGRLDMVRLLIGQGKFLRIFYLSQLIIVCYTITKKRLFYFLKDTLFSLQKHLSRVFFN